MTETVINEIIESLHCAKNEYFAVSLKHLQEAEKLLKQLMREPK